MRKKTAYDAGQGYVPDVVEADAATFHHVDKSAGSSDKKMTATSDVTYLTANVRPTINNARTQVRPIGKLQQRITKFH